MANTLRIKRTTTSNRPTSLANAELAFIEGSNILVYGTGTGGAGGTATSIIDIGGAGAFVTLSTNQTISGTKTFSVSPVLPTPAVDNNSTLAATTAYVLGQAGSANPPMDGTAVPGTSLRWARQDHVHPTDTSRAPVASPTFTGVPAAPTAAVDTNTTQLATTAFVVGQASAANPVMNGTVAIGTSLRYARADHVHPTDTSRAPVASPTFTGIPAAPTAAVDTNTTQLATTAFVLGQASSTTPAAVGTTGAVGTATRWARADHAHALPDVALTQNFDTSVTTLVAAVTADAKGRLTTYNSVSVSNIRLDQFGAPTADVNLNSRKITGLATPTAATDAANKGYVDNAIQGLSAKDSCVLASTLNVTVTYSATGGTSARGQITNAPLAKAAVDDGATGNFAAGDRILLKDQTTGAQNGIWVVTTPGSGTNGVWDRATDLDGDIDAVKMPFVFVEEGTSNNLGYVLSNDGSVVIGGASGTNLQWKLFSGAGQVDPGTGMTKDGNTLNVVGTAGRIVANADSLDLATVGTAGTYRSVTTDAYGRVTAGTNPTTLAGYGITDAQPLDADLTALAGISGTGFAVRTASNTWALRGFTALNSMSMSGPSPSLTITNGTGVTGGVEFSASSILDSLSYNMTQVITAVQGGAPGLQKSWVPVYTADSSVASSDNCLPYELGTTGYALLAAASASAARTTLGLGSIATQNASSVAITGGSITNLTTFDGITIDGGTY